MRTKVTNKDIATRLVSKLSVSSPKDKRHLSTFIDIPTDVKIDIIEAIAKAQVDFIIDSINKKQSVITFPLIGKFTLSLGRTIALNEHEVQAQALYGKEYNDLTAIEKKQIREYCKPIVVDKFVTAKRNINDKPTISINIFKKRLQV